MKKRKSSYSKEITKKKRKQHSDIKRKVDVNTIINYIKYI